MKHYVLSEAECQDLYNQGYEDGYDQNIPKNMKVGECGSFIGTCDTCCHKSKSEERYCYINDIVVDPDFFCGDWSDDIDDYIQRKG